MEGNTKRTAKYFLLPEPLALSLIPLFPFFLFVVKASTGKTPQPSPASHSAVQRAQGEEGLGFLGTPERLSMLRSLCLSRDRHRCVISRYFDMSELIERTGHARRQGSIVVRDDDGVPLADETSYEYLEVTHILPH